MANAVRIAAHEFKHEDSTYYGQCGSCTLIAFEGRKFVVTTRHQLGLVDKKFIEDRDIDTIRFASINNGMLSNILVDRIYYETDNPNQAYHDILFFGVHEEWLSDSADRASFFPVSEFVLNERELTYLYGHPFSRSETRYSPLHMYIRKAVIDGEINKDYRSQDNYVNEYKYTDTKYEVNGFSGGAAYSMFGGLGHYEVKLDGIIVTGGGGCVHVVNGTYLCRALAKIVG